MKVLAESHAAVYPSSLCAMAINGVNPPAVCGKNCLGKSRTSCSPPATSSESCPRPEERIVLDIGWCGTKTPFKKNK